jgi:hypothetical protein
MFAGDASGFGCVKGAARSGTAATELLFERYGAGREGASLSGILAAELLLERYGAGREGADHESDPKQRDLADRNRRICR